MHGSVRGQMLARTRHLQAVRRILKQFPVVAVVGPRQLGKSTLARQLAGP
jgi:predicted AAA+ superfamily ATPase